MKTISLKLSEEELAKLDRRRTEANMNRSDYIRCSIKGSSIQVIDKSQLFYQSLNQIDAAIRKAENRMSKEEYSAIREEVMKACQLLN